MIELPREALLITLGAEAAKGHLLVVGEPGAGKTWLLNTFVDSTRESWRRRGLLEGRRLWIELAERIIEEPADR